MKCPRVLGTEKHDRTFILAVLCVMGNAGLMPIILTPRQVGAVPPTWQSGNKSHCYPSVMKYDRFSVCGPSRNLDTIIQISFMLSMGLQVVVLSQFYTVRLQQITTCHTYWVYPIQILPEF